MYFCYNVRTVRKYHSTLIHVDSPPINGISLTPLIWRMDMCLPTKLIKEKN
jgi:hypothetical protein